MKIIINGQRREIDAPNLADALAELALLESQIATALNGEFVPRAKWADTPLQDGDALEVLSPMQGG
jgi:sulfur carrier protein